MKVAIVADWLVGGGAEKVVLELHRMFPNAPIYTSFATDEWRKRLDGKVITGYLQKWPFSKLRKFIPPLRGLWFSRLNLNDYDLVISSSGAEAKFVKTKPGVKHVAYIHAPTHYYWDRYDQYLKHPGFGAFDWLARLGLRLLVGPMRRWDHRAAQRPDFLIANSNFTKSQVKKYYGRNSVVIHPPVEIEKFRAKSQEPRAKSQRFGFVVAGRQTPYKKIDLAVAACTKLNFPLTVIGDGPEHKKLRKMAGPSVTFVGKVSDKEMVEYFQKAEAFIFPGADDFGIVAVEAMAAGCPVIAYKSGGALDYIGTKTGHFFDRPSLQSLSLTLKLFNSNDFDNSVVAKSTNKFSPKKFQEHFTQFLNQNHPYSA